MESLDRLYAELLHQGFIVLRQAVDAKDEAWVNAELELLHNIPSLIGEPNLNRHRYFWSTEREGYMAWVAASANERAKSRMNTYYVPLWREMEPVINELLSAISPHA